LQVNELRCRVKDTGDISFGKPCGNDDPILDNSTTHFLMAESDELSGSVVADTKYS
jgi:hypothetical protein